MKTITRTVKRLLARDIAQISQCTASKHKLKLYTQNPKGYKKIVRASISFARAHLSSDIRVSEELGVFAAGFVACRPLGLP